MRRTLLLVLAALALAACSPDFDPASKIEKLRVVAIRAEPPEIDPAGVQTAALTSLVLRADFDAAPLHTTTVVHLACVPAPGALDPSPCVMLSNLTDPTATIVAYTRQACAGGGAPGAGWPAIDLAGVERCAGFSCGPATAGGTPLPPAQVALPAGFAFSNASTDPAVQEQLRRDRILGVEAAVLAFALDATPDELMAGVGPACPAGDLAQNLATLWAAREHVLSVKRVVIRGPDSPNPANQNPSVDGILMGGVPLDPAGTTTVLAGDRDLGPQVPAGAAGQPEVYVKLDAAGVPIDSAATEEWVYSWFSTAGDLDHLHTRGNAETDRWTVPAGPGRARVVVVVRDLRDGTAWAVRDVSLAP